MYLIKDDTGKFLAQYLKVSCTFRQEESEAIRFDSLKRASHVLQTVTRLVPEYVILEIEKIKNKKDHYSLCNNCKENVVFVKSGICNDCQILLSGREGN